MRTLVAFLKAAYLTYLLWSMLQVWLLFHNFTVTSEYADLCFVLAITAYLNYWPHQYYSFCSFYCSTSCIHWFFYIYQIDILFYVHWNSLWRMDKLLYIYSLFLSLNTFYRMCLPLWYIHIIWQQAHEYIPWYQTLPHVMCLWVTSWFYYLVYHWLLFYNFKELQFPLVDHLLQHFRGIYSFKKQF